MVLFKIIRRIKKHGLVGGGMSLGVDLGVFKAHANLRVSLPMDQDKMYLSITALVLAYMPPCFSP